MDGVAFKRRIALLLRFHAGMKCGQWVDAERVIDDGA